MTVYFYILGAIYYYLLGLRVQCSVVGLESCSNMERPNVSEQCGIAASKGNQILGLIRRNITYKGKS